MHMCKHICALVCKNTSDAGTCTGICVQYMCVHICEHMTVCANMYVCMRRQVLQAQLDNQNLFHYKIQVSLNTVNHIHVVCGRGPEIICFITRICTREICQLKWNHLYQPSPINK